MSGAGSEPVHIFDPWDREPKYHDYGKIAERGGTIVDVTKCGLVLYVRAATYRALLPRRHADLFAKPCRKCFPETAA